MGSLLDRFMPEWDVAEHHEIEVSASPARAFAAVMDLDLTSSPTIRVLFVARGLGGPRRAHTLGDLERIGFVRLGEDPPHEVVLGIVGRFWRPMGGILRGWTAADFPTFAQPGYAKAAWNFTVAPAGDGAVVSTETRVIATDDAARRSFRRYWWVVAPFSSITRRAALGLVKRAAERS